jgi:hypothetical protein
MRRPSLRKAVAMSIGAHALLAAGVALLLTRHEERPAAPSVVDTRADVRMEFAGEANEPPAEVQVSRSEPLPPSEIIADAGGSRPLAGSIPHMLPAEWLTLLKKATAAQPAPVQPAAGSAPTTDPGPTWAQGGTAVHGPLNAKQSIVYVLDASGSMGEWGKFDAARRALVATLHLQPETVRFQVVVYSGTASVPVRSVPGACIPATAGNIARTIDALNALGSPTGRSNHAEGLRTALAFHPDLVLFFTDADDLPGAVFRGILKQASMPTMVCVGKVDARVVGTPVEVK